MFRGSRLGPREKYQQTSDFGYIPTLNTGNQQRILFCAAFCSTYCWHETARSNRLYVYNKWRYGTDGDHAWSAGHVQRRTFVSPGSFRGHWNSLWVAIGGCSLNLSTSSWGWSLFVFFRHCASDWKLEKLSLYLSLVEAQPHIILTSIYI